jgi:hypothetical protein
MLKATPTPIIASEEDFGDPGFEEDPCGAGVGI